MLYKKYFNIIFLILIMSYSNVLLSSTIENKCGEFVLKIKLFKGENISEMRQELYYQSPNQHEKLFYKTKPGTYLTISCINDLKKQFLVIFNEYYGGDFGPEDIYGVFNLNTKKILIKPSDWPQGNAKEVNRLIGYSLPSLFENNRSFCCEEDQYD